jgi:indolepyruvate ferredoxin oxidoreductase, alpha subunit
MAKSGNFMKALCEAPSEQVEILQGNIAFALGCVRGGVHAADGYPGTPSSEVIDDGLSQVQDQIQVGWSVNEAVAAAVGHGHTLAGRDCVVTMKIPGLYQAADIFTSGALFTQERGALVYYIASDFTPSSTQHTIDPRYLFKSCFIPVFEPRNHQEMYAAPAIAVEIGRKYRTQVVVMPNGALCHSEGLVRLDPRVQRDPVSMPDSLKSFNVLPAMARQNYDRVLAERVPALEELVENSPLNHWERGSGKVGVITCGVSDLYVHEVQQALGLEIDILSLAFTNPLPMYLIRSFCESIRGDLYVIEDGYRFIQEAVQMEGFKVLGKDPYSPITEWTPALVAQRLQVAQRLGIEKRPASKAAAARKPAVPAVPAVPRPPVICAGCPYRLFALEVALLRKKKQIDTVFGDIGCNTLLYYMNALDTGLAMGASEGERIGYVASRPAQAGRCISVVGDGTECHSGMDATRNAVYRNSPGVKVILDNSWAGMTGGQPSPTSPVNLAGDAMKFSLPETLKAHGASVSVVGAYDKKGLRAALKTALAGAEKGAFTTIVVTEGSCIRKSAASTQRVSVDAQACKKCSACLVCPGLEPDHETGAPVINNLCSGCGGHTPACVQMCPTGVLKAVDLQDLHLPEAPKFAPPPLDLDADDEPWVSHSRRAFPERISVAIRGVGGQGNLFFGSVLARLAFLAGYGEKNIIKGDTHGMAQMGGPVISTFGCGRVSSPVLLPGTADCLIVMEKSEVLRPGFLEMLKPGGTVLLATTRILPLGLAPDDYPSDSQIHAALAGCRVVEADVLAEALELGDRGGRTANVVMLGILSTLQPFDRFPLGMWLNAVKEANSRPAVWAANYAAFQAGRQSMLAESVR